MEAAAVMLEVARLTLKPGDVLVVRTPEGWPPQQVVRFREWLNAAPALASVAGRVQVVPHGVDLLVVDKAEVPCATS